MQPYSKYGYISELVVPCGKCQRGKIVLLGLCVKVWHTSEIILLQMKVGKKECEVTLIRVLVWKA